MPANERESEAEAAYRAANPTPAAASEHHPDDCPECKFTEQLAEYEATASESERRLRTMANREVLELRSALTAAQQERDDLAELVIGYRNQIRNECLRAEAAEQEAATLRAERDALRAALERIAQAPTFLQGGDGLSGPCVWCEMFATKLVAEDVLRARVAELEAGKR